MMFFTGWSRLSSKRRSRLVTMPTTRWPSSTGSPEMRCLRVSSATSRTVISGEMVIGSFTTPLSKRLAFETSAACSCGDMFLWMMPMPALLRQGDRQARLRHRVHGGRTSAGC
jgi:hypothetical protein